jgi:hypothetical protein
MKNIEILMYYLMPAPLYSIKTIGMLKHPVQVRSQIRITRKTNLVRENTFKHLHQGIGQMPVSKQTNLFISIEYKGLN